MGETQENKQETIRRKLLEMSETIYKTKNQTW